MRTLLLLALSVLISLGDCPAQDYLGMTKKQAQHKLHIAKQIKPALQFNEKNICTVETFEFNSKEAMKEQLLQILKKEKYGWLRINENQHVSGFKHQILLEFQDEKAPYRLQVLRTAWTKELYELLLKN